MRSTPRRPATFLTALLAVAVLAGGAGAAHAEGGWGAARRALAQSDRATERVPERAAGGVSIADARDGVTDSAFVLAPPNYRYVVVREPGSFVDCGAGQEARVIDTDGRDFADLTCAVTLTETVVIPAAARSARIIVHY